MYIISKKSEKDYYDGVAGTTGIDKTIIYNRQFIELEEKDFPKDFHRSSYSFKRVPSFHNLSYTIIKKEFYDVCEHASPFVIGFCGKLYIGWKLYSNGKDLPYGGKELITVITYNDEYMKKIVQGNSYSGRFVDNLSYVSTYNPIHLFREFNTPVFVYDGDYGRTDDVDRYWRNHPKFFINPLLKNYEFYKIFDAVQAFQEIQMFLGGVLGNKEKEIVNVADKYKIAQHGFDKWSFRKEPQK